MIYYTQNKNNRRELIKMKYQKFKTIKCPKCDTEYLPAEIFYPKHFFGRVSDITKDYSGKIISFNGDSLNLSENYICDKCGTAMKVFAKISFDSIIDNARDFNNDYVTKSEKKLELFEG